MQNEELRVVAHLSAAGAPAPVHSRAPVQVAMREFA